MQRVNHFTADPNANGPGKAGYRWESWAQQIPATVFAPEAANALQEELSRAVEAFFALNPGSFTQLAESIALRAMDVSDAAALALLVESYTGPTNLSGAAEYVGASNEVVAIVRPHTAGQIVTTADGGTTWTPASLTGGTTTQALYGVAAKPASAAGVRFVAVGAGGRLQCFDSSGAQTKATPAGGYASDFRAVCFHNHASSPRWFAVGQLSAIQWATPGSETGAWSASPAVPGMATDMTACASNGSALVVGGLDGQIARSLDHGASFAVVKSAGSQIAQVEAVPGGFMAIDTAGGVWRSLDNGATWSLFSTFAVGSSVSAKTGAIAAPRTGGGWNYYRRGEDTVAGHPVIPSAIGANVGDQVWRLRNRWVAYCQDNSKVYMTPLLSY